MRINLLTWLRARRQIALGNGVPQTAKLRVEMVDDETIAAPQAYNIIAAVLSDAGCHREVNEDYCLYAAPDDPELFARKGALAIVADGMGGHAAGEVASRMAVEVINRVYYDDATDLSAGLENAFREANLAIYQAAQSDARLYGMGTTCTALVLCNGLAFCAHIGDSRLYLIRDGAIYLMSEDHSAVMELVRRGAMSRERARNHADRNIILRALGTRPEADATIWQEPFPVRAGDYYVLCSDGLSDPVTDEEIKQIVLSANPDAACEQLIALARERGGHDNITAGVLHLQTR
jgi:protein phosphatase